MIWCHMISSIIVICAQCRGQTKEIMMCLGCRIRATFKCEVYDKEQIVGFQLKSHWLRLGQVATLLVEV